MSESTTEETAPNILEVAAEGRWDLVRSRIDADREEAKAVHPTTNQTLLHVLCKDANSEEDIFNKVLAIYPEACKVQDKIYSTTPLHVLCWNSQRSVSRVRRLLDVMDAEDLLIKNRFGGTALHSACGSHAWLPVIKALVKKNPTIIMQRTPEHNHTPLTALWHCHLQTIQGHMAIARLLEGEDVNDGHFLRFWEKVTFLACESFKLSPAFPKLESDEVEDYLLQGLIHLRAPLNIMKVALKLNPSFAAMADSDGNYPLHHIVLRRPFRVKDVEIISKLLEAYPEAAGMRNKNGLAPIFIALKEKMGWEEGLGEIVNADSEILASQDIDTGLYPFLLAASVGGRVSVNNTYNLLIAKPHLIMQALKS